jgi:2-C-methyl-D-erythritol 4-phosphate cytidylyltransferase
VKIIAVVVAGGNGSRLCKKIPKQYIDINGKLLVEYSLEKFVENNKIEAIQLVVDKDHEYYYNKISKKSEKFLDIAEAGEFRQDSVFSGLKAIEKYNPDYVLIHDSARPLVTNQIIDDVIQNLINGFDAVVPAIGLSDTIGIKNNDVIESIYDRERLVALQTPQGFNFRKIIECHRSVKSSVKYTDDISIAMSFNIKTKIIFGDKLNFKITDSFDLSLLLHYLNNKATL